MADLNATIGAVVREMRQGGGAMLGTVAAATNGAVALSTLSLLERGDKRWNADNVAAVAAGLGMSVADLLRAVAARLDDEDGVTRPSQDDAARMFDTLLTHGWAGLRIIVVRESNRAALERTAPATLALERTWEHAAELQSILNPKED